MCLTVAYGVFSNKNQGTDFHSSTYQMSFFFFLVLEASSEAGAGALTEEIQIQLVDGRIICPSVPWEGHKKEKRRNGRKRWSLFFSQPSF